MKAGELLRQLTANPFHDDYKGIYTQLGGTFVQFTTAKPDDEGNIFFFAKIEKIQ